MTEETPEEKAKAYREAVEAFQRFQDAPGEPETKAGPVLIAIREEDRELFEAAGFDTSHMVPGGSGILMAKDVNKEER